MVKQLFILFRTADMPDQRKTAGLFRQLPRIQIMNADMVLNTAPYPFRERDKFKQKNRLTPTAMRQCQTGRAFLPDEAVMHHHRLTGGEGKLTHFGKMKLITGLPLNRDPALTTALPAGL